MQIWLLSAASYTWWVNPIFVRCYSECTILLADITQFLITSIRQIFCLTLSLSSNSITHSPLLLCSMYKFGHLKLISIIFSKECIQGELLAKVQQELNQFYHFHQKAFLFWLDSHQVWESTDWLLFEGDENTMSFYYKLTLLTN